MSDKESQEIWHGAKELTDNYNRFKAQIDRLILLDTVWNKVVGQKAKYWKIDAVQKNTIFVKVNVVMASQELLLNKASIIKELNKYYKKAWIKEISII